MLESIQISLTNILLSNMSGILLLFRNFLVYLEPRGCLVPTYIMEYFSIFLNIVDDTVVYYTVFNIFFSFLIELASSGCSKTFWTFWLWLWLSASLSQRADLEELLLLKKLWAQSIRILTLCSKNHIKYKKWRVKILFTLTLIFSSNILANS